MCPRFHGGEEGQRSVEHRTLGPHAVQELSPARLLPDCVLRYQRRHQPGNRRVRKLPVADKVEMLKARPIPLSRKPATSSELRVTRSHNFAIQKVSSAPRESLRIQSHRLHQGWRRLPGTGRSESGKHHQFPSETVATWSVVVAVGIVPKIKRGGRHSVALKNVDPRIAV
jgi:hypothetical protein